MPPPVVVHAWLLVIWAVSVVLVFILGAVYMVLPS